ncbi:MAG TPA: glutamate 5-kinase [Arcobacter sp.]|nr:glutamate 5-kinase [Arcobacter sp.]HIP56342.1 glutamate 5-kinase [Arcobacter sp.]
MQTIVLKVGSAVLTEDGELALERLQNLVDFIVELKSKYNVILVSSGAVAAGYTLLKLDKSIIANKQALASIGQPLLLDTYRRKFNKHNIICSQVLLEASIFKDIERLDHARDAIKTLLDNNVVPIINENDVTAVAELVFGDNDQLSAHISHNFNSSLLVILTDIDGYYDDNPHTNKNAVLQKEVSFISKDELEALASSNTEFATGGIVTKLKAADFLMKQNKSMFLTSGFDLTHANNYLLKNSYTKGTIFKANDE